MGKLGQEGVVTEAFDDNKHVESGTTTGSGDVTVHLTTKGKKYAVSLIEVWNTSGSDRTVYFKFTDGSTRFKKKLADRTGAIINLINNRWRGTKDKNFILNADGTNIEYTVFGKEE